MITTCHPRQSTSHLRHPTRCAIQNILHSPFEHTTKKHRKPLKQSPAWAQRKLHHTKSLKPIQSYIVDFELLDSSTRISAVILDRRETCIIRRSVAHAWTRLSFSKQSARRLVWNYVATSSLHHPACPTLHLDLRRIQRPATMATVVRRLSNPSLSRVDRVSLHLTGPTI